MRLRLLVLLLALSARFTAAQVPDRTARPGATVGGVVQVSADTLSRQPHRLRLGDGRLSRANAKGEWTLVDVIDGAAPLTVALTTFKAMLDTVRITVARMADSRNSGFEERRRTGLGLYLTAEDLVRRGIIETSDVFRNLPGIRSENDSTGSRVITMRSSFGDYCSPGFHVNGLPMFSLSTFEIDNAVQAKNVRAIEVYTDATVPPQFQVALSGCGAIVIWTK